MFAVLPKKKKTFKGILKETKTTKTTNEEELTATEIKEELNIEHNWRNKNKNNRGMEVEYPVETNELEEETISLNDNDTLSDVSNFKEFQVLKKKETPKREGARYAEPCPQFEPSLHKYTSLPILQNVLKCKNIREIASTTIVSNTSVFDSIGQIISMTIENNEFYRQQVEEKECDIFSWAKLFIKKKITSV